MEFNIQRYLTENKLTLQSYMREEEDILEPQLANDDFEDDVVDSEDTWNKPGEDDVEDFEQKPVEPEEPQEKDIEVNSQEKMQLDKLKKNLSDYIQLYKQNKITIDDYKEKVYRDSEDGNIIKKIRSLEKKFYPAVSVGDEEENQTM